MKNFWIEMVEEIGVELGEEFIYTIDGYSYQVKIEENGLFIRVCNIFSETSLEFASKFIAGVGTIKKIPFRPRKGDEYYTIINNNMVINEEWLNTTADYTRFMVGIIFRTIEEARDYIPTWLDIISKL